jgi:CheY-like chemotaxis protein
VAAGWLGRLIEAWSGKMQANANGPEGSRRVMVVDDHVAAGDLLVEILSMEGYAVRVALCGRDAVVTAREFKPQIALLDVGLPDMDGFALARLLRADPQLQQIRLVALSGYGESVDAASSKQVGFDHYLVKPVDVEQLLSVLQSLA